MKTARKAGLLILWLIAATHAFALVWSQNLDTFPELPESVGIWISSLTRQDDSEDVEALTIYYMLIVSFVAVSVMTAFAIATYRLTREAPSRE